MAEREPECAQNSLPLADPRRLALRAATRSGRAAVRPTREVIWDGDNPQVASGVS
jgi:hypothetical protein